MIRQLSLLASVLAVAALLVIGQLPATAQQNNGGGGGRRGGMMMDVRMFAAQLGLTDDQLGKINTIITTQNTDITNALTPDQQATLKDQLATQQLDVMHRIGAIKLTDDQQTKVKAINDAMTQEISDMRQNGGGGRGMGQGNTQDKYAKQILALLTPEQTTALSADFAKAYGKMQTSPMAFGMDQDLRTKIQGIHTDANKQAVTIRDDATIPDDQKLVKINALCDSTIKSVSDLLTPDQQTQFKATLANQNNVPMLNPRSLLSLTLTDDETTKIHNISSKAQTDILAVLTPDQQQKLQDLRPQRRQRPQN